MSGHERLELSLLRNQRRNDLDPSLSEELHKGRRARASDSDYSEDRDVIAEEIARRHASQVGNNWRKGDLDNPE